MGTLSELGLPFPKKAILILIPSLRKAGMAWGGLEN